MKIRKHNQRNEDQMEFRLRKILGSPFLKQLKPKFFAPI